MTTQEIKTNHTPGPWTHTSNRLFISKGGYVVFETKSGKAIAECRSNSVINDQSELLANAKLISAAPELLEALKKLTDYGEAFLHDYGIIGTVATEVIDAAKAAIAKATGDK